MNKHYDPLEAQEQQKEIIGLDLIIRFLNWIKR